MYSHMPAFIEHTYRYARLCGDKYIAHTCLKNFYAWVQVSGPLVVYVPLVVYRYKMALSGGLIHS